LVRERKYDEVPIVGRSTGSPREGRSTSSIAKATALRINEYKKPAVGRRLDDYKEGSRLGCT